MFRLRLTRGQLSLLNSIYGSDRLKRRMIEATPLLAPDTLVRVGGRALRVVRLLGSGLIGVVYEVCCPKSGEIFALKWARGPFSFFQEALRVEAAVSRLLQEQSSLRPAKIIEAAPYALVKELCPKATLKQLILADAISPEMRSAFEGVLREAAFFEKEYALLLDLSPKNLCWEDGWRLLDAGPKLHPSSLSEVLQRPSFAGYLEAVKEKLSSKGNSPSALSREPEDAQPVNARRYAFLREWWGWFPCEDPQETSDPAYLFVKIDPAQREDEVLFYLDLSRPGELRAAQGADEALCASPLLRRAARNAWGLQYPEHPLPPGAFSEALPPLTEPLSLAELAFEVEPLGLGGALKRAVPEQRALQTPTLPVTPYQHWKDLRAPSEPHAPTDMFCHQAFPTPEGVFEELLGPTHFVARPPMREEKNRFCELTCLPVGASERAILFVPGLRAPKTAALPLLLALRARGLSGLFVMAHLGARSTLGQELATAGRWESILLWNAIDYITSRLGASGVDIIAASHGVFGATLVAELHPLVTSLALDSAPLRPLDLVSQLARLQNKDPKEALQTLKEHHLPHQPHALSLPSRPLRQTFLRPKRDRILSICGTPAGSPVLEYEVEHHAVTMRHDSLERGIPPECVEWIFSFLSEEKSRVSPVTSR